MAHTDACKIQVTQFVKKLVENGLSVNKACHETERESDGIPAETIRRWWKDINSDVSEKLVKNDQQSEKPELTVLDGGNGGNKKTMIEANQIMEKEVEKGVSTRTAAKKAAEETGMNEESIRVTHFKKMKISQKMAWGKAVRDIEKLTKYMMANCEVTAKIDPKIFGLFYYHMDTLEIFYNEIKKEQKNGL